jgi:hypothetical protein
MGVIRSKYTMNYDGAGNLTRVQHFDDTTPNGLSYRLKTTQYTRFDAANRRLQDSVHHEPIFQPTPNDLRWLYTYDAGGRLATENLHYLDTDNVWKPYIRYSATYLSNGLLQKAVHEAIDTAGWVILGVDSFGYAGSNPSYTLWEHRGFSIDSGQVLLLARTVGHLNAAGNWDTIQYFNRPWMTGVLTHTTTNVITYNSYQNWTQNAWYDVDVNGALDPSPDFQYNYYYELYEPTSIKEASPPIAFTVTPNPTATMVRAGWADHVPPPAGFFLADLQGRSLSTGKIAPGSLHVEVDLTSRASGTYVLSFTASDGTVLHREKVVRQ